MRNFIYSLVVLLFACSAWAEVATMLVQNGEVSITEIKAKAQEPIVFKVQNFDEYFEEVKSKELKFKVELPLNAEATISLPGMKAGIYKFKVDFVHHDSKERNDKVIECKIIVE